MIKINQITKTYGYSKILDNVSLTVNDGEVVSILGHNGSGKSTLLNCIAGLVTCDSGTITFDGRRLTDRVRSGYNRIAMVFQERNLFPHLTVLKNLFRLLFLYDFFVNIELQQFMIDIHYGTSKISQDRS